MSLRDVALALGPVLFAAFEIPETIAYGGVQRLAIHDMPGGQRVIDAIGPKPTDISWSGIFSGADATSRARLLDTLCTQGQVLNLSWDIFFYSVVIQAFEARYHNTGWVPYELSVTVLQDDALAVPGLIDDLAADLLGDGQFASTFAANANISLTTLQTALAVPNAGVRATGAYLAANTALVASQSTVELAQSSNDIALNNYATNGLLTAADVFNAGVTMGNAANLAWANAYLGRLQINLSNAGT